MTPEEITKLAEEYVAKVYGGDTDFIDEAENVISWLLRTHCIVSKEKVKEEYQKALNQIAGGRGEDMIYHALSRMELANEKSSNPSLTPTPLTKQINDGSMKNYNKGEKVSIKRCYEVHINGYITDVCPGEVGTVHWDCGDTVEVYFGDYIMLEVNKEDIEPCISEETKEVTIDGWLTRSVGGSLTFSDSPECRRGHRVWYHKEGANVVDLDKTGLFPNNLFPDLTWESEPLEVTVTVKLKKQ